MIAVVVIMGLATGCRTMVPMVILCWFAFAGRLPLDGTWGFWAAKLVSAIVFTGLGIGELFGDKLARTPNRTGLFPLAARVAFGGVVGALVATGLHGSLPVAVVAGAFSALVGAFGGFYVRRWLTKERGFGDFGVALLEDAATIVASVAALMVAF